MTFIRYTAIVKSGRMLELPEEAEALNLKPGQAIEIQLEERANDTALHRVFKTPQERIAAMDAIAERNAVLPILPDSAFDRESIYEDSL